MQAGRPESRRLKPRLKAGRHETDLRRLGNGAGSCRACPLLLDCLHVILPAESRLQWHTRVTPARLRVVDGLRR